MMRKQAEEEISANMPLLEGIFFEIHGSELKPDPVEIASQAARICKPHRVFFFGIGEHSLYGFLTVFIKFTQGRSVPIVFNKFKPFCEAMVCYISVVLLLF